MPDNDFITRGEYSARHEELLNRVTKVEALLEAYRDAMTSRFDRLSDKIDASENLLSTQIANLKDEVFKQRNGSLRYALSVTVSFILGGGLIGIIQYLHPLR